MPMELRGTCGYRVGHSRSRISLAPSPEFDIGKMAGDRTHVSRRLLLFPRDSQETARPRVKGMNLRQVD